MVNWHSQFYANLFATKSWLVPSGHTTDFRGTWASHSGRSTRSSDRSPTPSTTTCSRPASPLPPGNAYYAYNSLQPPRIFTLELRYKF